ncbi:MAG: DUF2474 domain-containing protein [Neisseriaceae bacterium]|nr:DUF2474 domain-containing protein [Neisseriaceae bacterium]
MNPTAPQTHNKQPVRSSWLKKLGWMALIWLGSIAALSVVAYFFRYLMGMINFTS